jgi:hypothetical protein
LLSRLAGELLSPYLYRFAREYNTKLLNRVVFIRQGRSAAPDPGGPIISCGGQILSVRAPGQFLDPALVGEHRVVMISPVSTFHKKMFPFSSLEEMTSPSGLQAAATTAAGWPSRVVKCLLNCHLFPKDNECFGIWLFC